MKMIYKYPINPGKNVITLPLDSQLLNTIDNDGQLCIYAIVETLCKETIQVTIYVYGTGWDDSALKTFDMPEPDSRWSFIPGQMQYMTTVKQGYCVWHVFAQVPKQLTDNNQ